MLHISKAGVARTQHSTDTTMGIQAGGSVKSKAAKGVAGQATPHAAVLPQHLQDQRDYMICGPNVNSDVR